MPAHDVCGQADARPRADAGDRAGEPGFKNKPGGLIVDYLGLADQLKKALATYTESGGRGNPDLRHGGGHRGDAGEIDVACDMMHGFDRAKWVDGKPSERLALIPGGQEHILEQEGREAEVRAGGDGAFQGVRAIGGER